MADYEYGHHGFPRNRRALNGARSTSGVFPVARSATTRPVIPPSVQPMCWCPNAYSTPGTREEGPSTGSASGNVGRNPSQSFSPSRAPNHANESSFFVERNENNARVSASSCSKRLATGPAFKPPSSTSPADRTPPDMGVTMNPPSEEHTGRVKSGSSRASVSKTFFFGAHCTLYPRSVSSGTASPHCSARCLECAPAAMTTVPASR
mmetsp:Transcript_3944/g.16765  ORF Transcript_3944/g.16765 Transcript_3944/m.16765 type:complete len:207 (-) Transcript_3944:933-1553(-)